MIATDVPVVGHVVREWLPGSATFVHTLVRHQRRVRPVVLAAEITRLNEFPAEVVDLGRPRNGAAAWLERRLAARQRLAPWDRRLARAARRANARLLHAHFGTVGFRALATAERTELPLVTTFYGFDLAMPEREPGWAGNYERLFAAGSAYIVEGPYMGRTLQALGAPAERVHVVRIGLDLDLFPFRPREPARPLILLQGARLVAKKGVDLSIRAFAAARPRLGSAELWIVGDGPQRAALEELATRLCVADGVRFLGAMAYRDYQEIVQRAHVCLQPSRTAPDGDTEGGAPTVLLEMQASGMPVVATRHADIPFVVARPDELAEEEDAEGIAAQLVRLSELSAADWRARAADARALVEREHDACRQAARVEDVYFLGRW